ncbi:exocyst complex component sec8 [Infundibulicybe gibba]|nr:exocyst complex component sec8 [Infundibulicybe gibba]
MSRAPPFPTNRRARSPSVTNGNSDGSFQPLQNSSYTKPLQISRPSSRPVTPPGNTAFIPSSARVLPVSGSGPTGPSRPQRSELRSRVSETLGSERVSQDYYRDSTSTVRSDASFPTRSRAPAPSSPKASSNPRSQTQRSLSRDDGDKHPLLSIMRATTNGSEDMELENERQNEVELERLRQQRIRDKMPGRRANGKTRAGDIDAVLDQVKDGWEFVIDPDFNNVDLALQLLDDSSLGKDINSFRRTKDMLSKALKGSVDKHYQAFAASLPHHASLLNHLGAAQSQIAGTRASLLEAKEALGNKRADLVQLWSRGQTLEEMMRILDHIEYLKLVPDLLETLISEKRLLQASVLLVRSMKVINKPDMTEIGAISDLRSYLNGQETALREILIDELHSHLYLKSFWCESRWSPYSPNQQQFPKVEFDQEVERRPSSPVLPPASPSAQHSRLDHYLNEINLRPNDPPHDLEEPTFDTREGVPLTSNLNPSASTYAMKIQSSTTVNPEADSFTYMETLLESLAVLGKLGSALDNIAQRLPTEIYGLVESTIGEVEERAEYGKRVSSTASNGPLGKPHGVYIYTTSDTVTELININNAGHVKSSHLRLTALESSTKQIDLEILRDLFWTVYSKLNAVAQGLRVLYEVSNRIGSRRDFKDSSGAKPGALFPLGEIWSPVQAEVRALIYDYLTDEEQGSVSGRNPISSINEILREGRFGRDKLKTIFRFVDTNPKSANRALKQHEDELTRMLKDTMPGLVSGSAENSTQPISPGVTTDDRVLGLGQRHRLLIQPNAFHVTILFQPTLSFLNRISSVLPPGSESAVASTNILDDFVLKVYLPQLEEKVSLLFQQAVTGHEAFQPDPNFRKLSSEPLLKASTQLMALVNSLCAMLQSSPFHRENYTRLILGVVIQFYQRCSDRFQDLVSGTAPDQPGRERPVALAAQWAQRSELNPCLCELLTTPGDDLAKQQQLSRQETNIELELLGEREITNTDLIPSIRNIASLAILYRSVSWFSSELSALKAHPEDVLPPTPGLLEPKSAVTPFSPNLPVSIPLSLTDQLILPLSQEMSFRFQALLKTYNQLSELILHTIRIDIRCRSIYYLNSALRQGDYSIEYEAGEPDPHTTDLNTELGQCHDLASIHLPGKERLFIFASIGYLMEETLISNAQYLRRPTNFGIKNIMRNILALQQSIKTITNDQRNTEFDRVKEYYSLFFMPPQDMLQRIRNKQAFNFDEYQTMLNMQCGVDPTEGEMAASRATDRNYSMYVIDLHGLEMGGLSP